MITITSEYFTDYLYTRLFLSIQIYPGTQSQGVCSFPVVICKCDSSKVAENPPCWNGTRKTSPAQSVS